MNRKYKPYLMLAPFLIVIFSTFFVGLINGIVQSLGYMPYFNMDSLTLKYYEEVIRDKDFLMSLLYSFYISLASSAASIVLGVLVAFAILGLKKEHKLFALLYRTPIIIPHLAAVVLVFNIFSQTGIAARLIHSLNMINDPNQFPLLVFDRWGAGIILVYLYKQIPFVTMTVYAVLKNVNGDFAEVAYNLGASRMHTLFKVVLPMLSPVILSAFLMIFAFTFGAFEVPFLIGSPAITTLPVKAYIYYTDPDFTFRPYTMVINVIISVLSLCFIWLYIKMFKRAKKYGF